MHFVSAIRTNHACSVWLWATVFCMCFSAIYEHFSFGVYSAAMIFLFLWPFLLGFLPSLLAGRNMGRLWNDGVLCLCAGSLAHGIFEIYGTASPWPMRLMAAGGILMGIQLVLQLMLVGMRNEQA